MACAVTFLLHKKEQRVKIAVVETFANKLAIATGVAFTPHFLPTAAVVHHASFSKGHAQCFSVHPRHHEHLLSVGVLRDHGNQAIGVVFHKR